jgi:hypothetical protein
MPAPLAVQQDPRVTVQLKNSDGSCWEASYVAPASRNATESFKDTID